MLETKIPKVKGKRAPMFQPGNKHAVGKGRPTKAKEKAYVEAIASVVPLETFKTDVIGPQLEAAQKGDFSAAKFLTEQLAGKPVQRVVVEGGGLEALANLQALVKSMGGTVENEVRSGEEGIADEGEESSLQ